jgi:hypothetical protein
MTTADDHWRRSRLDPRGAFLVVGDLHNHTTLSDGRGDPGSAYAQLRAAGLDVAALTDHASIPREHRHELSLGDYPDEEALAVARLMPRSFDEDGWRRTGELADAFDAPGEFTALRGFEWTEPWLGHVNVWFSDGYRGVDTPGSLAGLFAFLEGDDQKALYGYNHPGREPGRHGGFALPPGENGDPDAVASDLTTRMVALEAFNRADDYLFGPGLDPADAGGTGSALVACLDAGWRPGLIGCSDEHGSRFGLAGRGRTGLWVHEHSRDGVREALSARRVFATRERGLRVDATLDGVRMGSALPPGDRREPREGALAVDLDVEEASSPYAGREVALQLLCSAAATGGASPEVAVLHSVAARVGDITRATVTLPADATWVLLRVADPARGYGGTAPAGHPGSVWALAYASPWYA